MTVWLIANVGNSDVIVSDDVLPKLVAGHWSVRRRGEEIANNLDHYLAHITLPLIGPTIRWLVQHEKTAIDQLQIVLFASDQPVALTREDERQKDTWPMAQVARALLSRPDSFGRITGLAGNATSLRGDQIDIRRIDGTPADYSNMFACYSQELPKLQAVYPGCPVFFEVSGGTPAMTAMLILIGVEVFGSSARTLYINRGDNQPYEVSVTGELYAQRVRRTLRTQVQMYAYAVAQRTLAANERHICSDERQRSVLAALLTYADRRLAFDFDEARTALSRARQATTGKQQVLVQFWLRQLESTDISLQLSELFHSTSIKQSFGDYADFAQRLFRFQEASFRYMAEEMGMRADGIRIDSDWLREQTELRRFTSHYSMPSKQQVIAVRFDQPLNRTSLGAIVDYYLANGMRSEWQSTAQKLHALSAVAELRNRGLAGHGFQGISLAQLEERYGAPASSLFDSLKSIYQELFKKDVGESPYQAVNELIYALLE